MKGVVFTMLGEMVEERFGYAMWDELIEVTAPASEGVYVSTGVYADAELNHYVTAMSDKLGVPASELVFAFGEYVLGRFYADHPSFFEGHTLRSFLESVHDVIHVEVMKLHPDAILPSFEYEDLGDNRMAMVYRSERKLGDFAEGLITGAATAFNEQLECVRTTCMSTGADHCRFELTFGGSID